MQTDKKQKGKIYDGRMMQGICVQWFIDKYGVNREFELYCSILRLTFGFRKRYAYIPFDKIPFSKNIIKKYRDNLTKKGIIEWKITKGYTMYKIMKPKDEINNFILKNDKDSNNKEESEPAVSKEEEGALYGWEA